MLAVVGHPRDDRALRSHRTEYGKQVLHGFRRLKRTVGKQTVEPDGYPDRGEHVHPRSDDQIGGADEPVPEKRGGRDRRPKGEHDGAQVDELLGFFHLRMHQGSIYAV